MRVPKSARTKCQIFIGTPTKEEEPYRPGAQGISIRVERENCQLQIRYAAKASFTHRASRKVFQDKQQLTDFITIRSSLQVML